MPLRPVSFAALPLAVFGASGAPGCGCAVSHCCEWTQNKSDFVEAVFNADGAGMRGYTLASDDAGVSPACSFLNLIPGVHDEGGICSQPSHSAENATVCEAISADEQAVSRLQSGRSILSVFVEPGACAGLQGGACWESEAGPAYYDWRSFDAGVGGGWCAGSVAVATPALAWMVSCPARCQGDGQCGLLISAKWVDGNASASEPGFDSCSGDYSGGLQATMGADAWTAGSEGSPRWSCFDVPPGQMGPGSSRVLAYSIGDLPCVAAPTTTGSSGTATTTAESSSCTRVGHVILSRIFSAALAVSLWA
mmetsp:Transcript_42752/g.113506  ORF Transcript_42752/g.113506 Transcript_42752/m.113506 type:complete len:308 (-) Transcript_42752:235-1158(-)